MANKPARKPTALPFPLDDLITTLTRAGVKSATNDGGTALRMLLSTHPYDLTRHFPCPQFLYTNPDPLVPAAGFDVVYDYDVPDLDYNVSITDMTTKESFGAFPAYVAAGTPNPVVISIPAQAVPFHPAGGVLKDIVVADHDYVVHVYASFGGSPYGCISKAFITLSNDELKKALFRVLTAQGQLPFGHIPPEVIAANAKPVEPKK